MKVVCTIEARMGSTRLPGKMNGELHDGMSTLEVMVERVRRASVPDEVVVATSTDSIDDVLAAEAEQLGVACYRGSESDVLSRVLDAAKAHNADVICETTGDCPLHDPAIIDQVCASFLDSPDADYVSNVLTRRWPNGFDVEVFGTETLQRVADATTDEAHREHVTSYIRERHDSDEFTTFNVSPPPRLNDLTKRVTLDYPADLKLIREVLDHLYGEDGDFDAYDVVSFLDENPKIRAINDEHREFV